MAATKQPQGHKPKKGVRTATVDGITVHVDPDVFNDANLLRDMRHAQKGDPLLMVDVAEKVYGNEADTVFDALTDKETGRADVERFFDFLTKVMTELAPNS
ncbi:MAG: hypothetical protein ABF747_02280 [Bifidobacterium sp.]|uniref:Tail assembly chaperone n=1 Tax=Bifidobacterium fermentum TaxID=3059035 RepID=A0AB39UH84_9BIFI